MENNLITLYAKRNKTSVNIYDNNNNLKAIFTNNGYRPTKATKKIVLNCFNYKLKWLKTT